MDLIYNKEYWNRYQDVTDETSQFAHFCRGFMKPCNRVLDVGSGNGRDSIYFKLEGMDVTALDYSEFYRILFEMMKIDFVKYDLEDGLYTKEFDFYSGEFDFIYCRFLLHAIPEDFEKCILKDSLELLDSGMLMIEARSDKGSVPKDNHYRRLININQLSNKLESIGFKIIYQVEQRGLAIYKNEDPIIIRIVCQRS